MTSVPALMPPISPRGMLAVDALMPPPEARQRARHLLRTARSAALSTLDPSGYPYASVIVVATDQDGTPVFPLVAPALQARNILADPRVALAFAEPGAVDPMARMTLVGRAVPVAEDRIDIVRRRYLAARPKATILTTINARFFRLVIEAVSFLGGANRIAPADLLTDLAGADTLLAAEAEILAAINARPGGGEAYAVRQGGRPGRWRAVGLDPEGLDLARGEEALRVPLPECATTPERFLALLDRAG